MTKKISARMDYLRTVSDGIGRELFDIHDAAQRYMVAAAPTPEGADGR